MKIILPTVAVLPFQLGLQLSAHPLSLPFLLLMSQALLQLSLPLISQRGVRRYYPRSYRQLHLLRHRIRCFLAMFPLDFQLPFDLRVCLVVWMCAISMDTAVRLVTLVCALIRPTIGQATSARYRTLDQILVWICSAFLIVGMFIAVGWVRAIPVAWSVYVTTQITEVLMTGACPGPQIRTYLVIFRANPGAAVCVIIMDTVHPLEMSAYAMTQSTIGPLNFVLIHMRGLS
mmetsp:Transcript_2374/g.3631  ORF Transcript_2374/g.3631 Transcript_2374/m.3631 type:complete len:231 (+) Transcript_2374:1111-1803(+)